MKVIIFAIVAFLAVTLVLVLLLLLAKAKLTSSGAVKIDINEGNKVLEVASGSTLLNTLSEQGIFLPSACGGKGACGQCKCQVVSGGGEILPTERGFFNRREINEGWRLGCQVKVKEDMQIKVPASVLSIKKWECEVVSNNNVATFIKEFCVKIPDGEYRLDLTLRYDPYTIVDIGNTDYSWVDEDMEGWALPLEDAKLTVNGNRFDLEAFVNNTDYHVTFEGDYSLTTSIINDYVSSLTQDTVIDVSNCSASVSSYGDYWDCGYNNWCIEFVCNDGMKYGTYLVIDFLNNSTTDFTGTYVASGFSAEDETMPDFRADVFIPGFRVADDADLLLGSLFMVYKDGLCVSQAPLYEGTVTITSNGDGTYTVVIDALDDAPEQHKITLTWTGTFA